MAIRFDETMQGKRFFNSQLPKLIAAIEANTAELKRANDLKEQELALLKGDVDIAELPDEDDPWD